MELKALIELYLLILLLEEIVRQVRDWLSPPNFVYGLERAQDIRKNGTAEWLFEEAVYKTWADRSLSKPPPTSDKVFGGNALWISG